MNVAKPKVERVEADVIGNIKSYCKDHKIKLRRNSMAPGVETGWPDLEVYIPGGRPFLLETKKPGERPDPKQEHVMGELRELGYDVDWCDNSVIGIAMIEKRMLGARVH